MENGFASRMQCPVQEIVPATKERRDSEERITGQPRGGISGIPLQRGGKEEDTDERDDCECELGFKARGEEGSSCRLEAYRVRHGNESQMIIHPEEGKYVSHRPAKT